MTTVLKALVGSRAHGLHREDSDYDYRGVHLVPTKEILSLNYKYSPISWLEDNVDETSYEIGHFLHLCTKANPSVLEVLVAEKRMIDTPYAQEMRELMPYMFTPQDAFNAFAGYSKNQQKKLLEGTLDRPLKYGVAYVRTAYNLWDLFETGSFSLSVESKQLLEELVTIKSGELSNGDIIDLAETYIGEAKRLLPNLPNRQNLQMINDFLIRVRRENF